MPTMMRHVLVVLVSASLLLTGCRNASSPNVIEHPSRVARPTEDPRLLLGTYALSTERPPVVDGDTIRVDGLDESLRLLGIDTEETFKDEGNRELARRDWDEYVRTMNAGRPKDRPAKYGTPMGEAAKTFAETFFRDLTHVRLEYDDPERKRGYYNRHLVYVLAERDGHFINYNVEVVRQGYSPYFTKYGRSRRYHAEFLAAEREAREHERGIWAKEPAHCCYPDYPALLAWWSEREAALLEVERLRAVRDDIYVLGIDSEWERLKTAEGKTVTVVGSLGNFRENDTVDIQYVGHRNRLDFAVVGPKGAFKNHPLLAHPGDILLITGKVSLHRERPQFRLETVSVKPVARE